MSDIVERLRRVAKELPQTSGNQAWLKPEDTTAWEAAAEIEKLRAALRFYAGDEPWKWTSEDYGKVARAALGEKE